MLQCARQNPVTRRLPWGEREQRCCLQPSSTSTHYHFTPFVEAGRHAEATNTTGQAITAPQDRALRSPRTLAASPCDGDYSRTVFVRHLRQRHECILRRRDVQTLEAGPQVRARILGRIFFRTRQGHPKPTSLSGRSRDVHRSTCGWISAAPWAGRQGTE
jgi:hypothetical protein